MFLYWFPDLQASEKHNVSGDVRQHVCPHVKNTDFTELPVQDNIRIMTRGIFLAGNESVLFSAVAAEVEKRVEKYTAAVIHASGKSAVENAAAGTTDNSGQHKKIPLVWNPGSPISNRTIILSAENWLGQINDALLVCSPPAIYKPAGTLAPAEIESWINTQIKGWFFLIRELAVYFRGRGSGSLALLIPEVGPGSGESASDLFGVPAAAMFRALAQEILLSASVEPFYISGFTFPDAGKEKEFAAWAMKILDEGSKKNSGKWFKYAKFPLFK